jgi:UDP-N-acetylmuramoyl-L-alanyl-D-glutamate--2,6-diaminopimelate ligase
VSEIPGRVESVKNNLGFEIIVDYAHTPDSLKALYEAFSPENPPTILGVSGQKTNKKLICVLGNTGGGRDIWKRPEMGKIADQYCEEIILTNEDPYDEDPRKIVDEMAVVIDKKKLTIEMDRREAIKLAIKKAEEESEVNQNNVVVLITGKGTDPYIMEANGKKTPWSDKKVVEEELKKSAR